MGPFRTDEYLVGLVQELHRLPSETEWVEFKVNQCDPQMVGEYISALSNAAALNGKAFAYLVWGIENEGHTFVGTRFSPSAARKGNEPLETWLLRSLTPKVPFCFYELAIDGNLMVVLEVGRAFRQPVRFRGEAFIRVGQVKKPLRDAGDRERELWRILDQMPFENLIAAEHVTSDDVLGLLDYPAYFDLLQQPLPQSHDGILATLTGDNLTRRCEAGEWDITNLGALLLAKKIDDFPGIRRKAMRVIQYKGTGRIETLKEKVGVKGYAAGIEGLIGYINGLLPSNEVIEQALRKTVPMFPELSVRELVVNALIHQDLFVTGAGPMVEIFEDRIEITNPGEPLVDPQRFIDTPPKSRNEALASMMRRFRICEERGTGIDKVVFQVELYQLPAPLFEVPEGFTRAVLFSHRPLAKMDKADRLRACYLHACLRYVTRKPMTNASIRQRFGISEKNASTASRLLGEAVDAGLIVIQDPEAGTRIRSYLPFWAAPVRNGG